MPVVDESGILTDVIFWEDFFPDEERRTIQKLDLPIVIMAGGKGTRLRPFTNILPKPMMPIDEKTILEHIMDRFTAMGCNRFFLSVNYKADILRFYLDSLNNPTYHISYFKEDHPLGTAGSLSLLKGQINTTFFVSNCDILIEEEYAVIYNYHIEQKNELTLVAALKHLKIPYGTLETTEGGQLTALVEKPELTWKINSGLYILEPHLLEEIPDNTFLNITDLIGKIKERNGRVGVFPVSENSWKDIGEWNEYLRISKKFNDRDSAFR
jgi:NDP-sugar pyrophosphorylase family protein